MNIPKKHVAALIAIVTAWLAVAALGTAIIAIIVNSAIRREEAAERAKKRVENYAAALSEAWKTKEDVK